MESESIQISIVGFVVCNVKGLKTDERFIQCVASEDLHSIIIRSRLKGSYTTKTE